jgi:hypothetical protein
MAGDRGQPFVSVLADMRDPDYRKQIERKQALENVYPEELLVPAGRALTNAVRSAVAPKAPLASQEELMRLYRADAQLPTKPVSPWLMETPEYKSMMAAKGRWFTDDLAEAQWYLDDVQKGGKLHYIDLPKKEAESFRLSNMKKTEDSVHQYSRRPDKEFFVTKEHANRMKEVK